MFILKVNVEATDPRGKKESFRLTKFVNDLNECDAITTVFVKKIKDGGYIIHTIIVLKQRMG